MNIIGVLSVITFKTISTIRDKKKRLTIIISKAQAFRSECVPKKNICCGYSKEPS